MIIDLLGDPMGPLVDYPVVNDSDVPAATSLFGALKAAFEADAALVAALGHDQAAGPHKFWRDEVAPGVGGVGVAVPPPYVVASILGSGAADVTFRRGSVQAVTVLLKTFATTPADAERLGGMVADLLEPSRDRPLLRWQGGGEMASFSLGEHAQKVPGRGVSGRQLYARYNRFGVVVAGQY